MRDRKPWFHYFCSPKIIHSNGKTDPYLMVEHTFEGWIGVEAQYIHHFQQDPKDLVLEAKGTVIIPSIQKDATKWSTCNWVGLENWVVYDEECYWRYSVLSGASTCLAAQTWALTNTLRNLWNRLITLVFPRELSPARSPKKHPLPLAWAKHFMN